MATLYNRNMFIFSVHISIFYSLCYVFKENYLAQPVVTVDNWLAYYTKKTLIVANLWVGFARCAELHPCRFQRLVSIF